MGPLQEPRSDSQGPQEWEMFEDIPLSMQPSPIIRISNVPGKLLFPATQLPSRGILCCALLCFTRENASICRHVCRCGHVT